MAATAEHCSEEVVTLNRATALDGACWAGMEPDDIPMTFGVGATFEPYKAAPVGFVDI